MRFPVYAILLLSIPFLTNCNAGQNKNPEKEQSLFATFEVRYLDQEKELRGLATFRAGKTPEDAQTVQLPKIDFQGEAMKAQSLGERGFRYIYTKRGGYNGKYAFSFKTPEGDDQSFELSMPPLGDYILREGQVQKSKGMTIEWPDAPLNADQSLIFMFTDSLQKTSSTFIKGPTKSPEVFVPAKDLTGLTPGKGQLYLVKKQLSRYEKEDFTAQSILEFYTKPINIEVIE